MLNKLEDLLNYLEVERIDKYLFIGRSPEKPRRIFGGQVLSQALNAAIRTVEGDRIAHSMHGYFLRGGDPSRQIVYEVDPIRDGKSFATRRVVATQDGKAIFNTSVSFHIEEEGLEHQITMPDVPPPEELETDREHWERTGQQQGDYEPPRVPAIERRMIDRRDNKDPVPDKPRQHTWFKVNEKLSDELTLHQTLLAYISDVSLLGTALRPHPYTGASKAIQLASLDHGLWFHRPFRVDEYLLYTMDSPTAYGSRGFSRGNFYNREGALIASTTQESLMRLRDDD